MPDKVDYALVTLKAYQDAKIIPPTAAAQAVISGRSAMSVMLHYTKTHPQCNYCIGGVFSLIVLQPEFIASCRKSLSSGDRQIHKPHQHSRYLRSCSRALRI